MTATNKYIAWFREVDKNDIPLVGGKGANLGEMTQAGFPVPNGYIVTSQAYYHFIKENNLATKIKHLLGTTHFEKSQSLMEVSQHIKKLIMDCDIPDEITQEIFAAYKKLGGILSDALVAVRSSATAEDLPNASFAGQQETFLNVKGDANLLLKIKEAWASLFNARAIFYRHEQKFDHFKIGIALPVQLMVESEKSGIMFTRDPMTNDKNKIVIEAIYGLGELIVQGAITPDHYEVEKKTDKILLKDIAVQSILLKKVGTQNKEVTISKSLGSKQKITDNHIKELAKIGTKLENHYYFPQDIEWAIKGDTVYIVQTRPITTLAQPKKEAAQDSTFPSLPLILSGSPASPGISSGPVKIIKDAKDIGKVMPGDILVTTQTNPDFVPAMKKAAGIVTDKGGRTSHAAIVSRELGIPAIVGAEKATTLLKNGEIVTIHGGKGEVYRGGFSKSDHPQQNVASPIIHTVTKVYTNLAQPDLAESIAKRHVDGIGLLRAEFMMADIGTHPKKFIKDHKQNEYIARLSEEMAKFCKAFHPRPVVYRTSDFKTNEYRDLIGGREFEPVEPNPMLGYRGAFRYMNDPHVFDLELEAIKTVRNKLGYRNLWIMLPFVRTVAELVEVKKLVALSGLHRSPSFKIWMMVEIPSNVILLEKFIAEGIDGVSIGSNDLTMLLLGTDRDNSEVAREFDEQNDAALWAYEKVIKTAHAHKITSSICGQAPSLYPSLLEKLVKWGITSVSVSPDAIDQTRKTISEIEKNLIS